jgi:uncharacterized protein YdeI (YjbR/CyaY-like superfamily)
MADEPKPRFFKTAEAFRAWLEKNHDKQSELWMGYYKKASGKGGLQYKAALDEALCWGWIDGLVKSVDGESYKQRWTPRKKGSHWSLVNVRRMGELEAEGRVADPGRAAFARRTPERTGRMSFETEEKSFSPAQLKLLKANRKAWEFWESAPAGYKRQVKHWVVTAKQEATRERRMQLLIQSCEMGQKAPPYITRPGKK